MGHFSIGNLFDSPFFSRNLYTAQYLGIQASIGSIDLSNAGIFRIEIVGFSRMTFFMAQPTAALILDLEIFSLAVIPSTNLSLCFLFRTVLADAPITFPICADVNPFKIPLEIDLISGLEKLLRRFEGDRTILKIPTFFRF